MWSLLLLCAGRHASCYPIEQSSAATQTARRQLNSRDLLDSSPALAPGVSPIRIFPQRCISREFWNSRNRFLLSQATTTTNCRLPSSRRGGKPSRRRRSAWSPTRMRGVGWFHSVRTPTPRPVQTGGGRSVTHFYHTARHSGSPAPPRVARSPVVFLVATLRWPPAAALPVWTFLFGAVPRGDRHLGALKVVFCPKAQAGHW